ncbi:MAG: N-acetyltransferase family protein [Bacteroidota bacterium]
MEIRPATAEDYGRIAEIYNVYIAEGGSTMEETPKESVDIEAWIRKFNSRERLYVLQKEALVIGWGIIKRYSDREGYRFAAETAVYLDLVHLGKGYGKQMKRFLIDESRAMGYHHLVAKIFATNEASIAYNLRLGYEIVGRQKQIGWKNDQWMDIVIMQYLIQ